MRFPPRLDVDPVASRVTLSMPAFQISGKFIVIAYARQIGVAIKGGFPSGSVGLPGLRAAMAVLGSDDLTRETAGPLHDVLHKSFEHQEIGSLLVPPLDVGFDDYDAVGWLISDLADLADPEARKPVLVENDTVFSLVVLDDIDVGGDVL